MRILFLGDIVGRSGRDAVCAMTPGLRKTLRADFVIANGENASHGFGLSPDMATAFFAAGVDVITLGNHSWDRKELIPFLATENRVVRPLNYPPGTPGAGSVIVSLADGRKVLVLNAMGRLFMDPMDCPFRGTAELLARHSMGPHGTVQAIVADFHGEATSEKWSYGHSFDGKMSLIVGTHTHSPSADHHVMASGTAFQSDAGMCGDYDSVIGMNKHTAATRFWRKTPGDRLAPAEGEATLCGVLVTLDSATGLALKIEPVRQGGRLSQILPESIA